MRWRQDERGQALLLAVGFSLVLFATAGVVVDGTRAWLLRRGLQNTVDAASLVAAGQLDVDALYASGGTTSLVTERAAVDSARSIVADRGLADALILHVDGDLVHARATATLRTSFLSLVGLETISVAAEATATPVFGE